MSIQPGAPTTTAEAQAILAIAADYQGEQTAETQRLVAAALVLWATIDPKHVLPSWTIGGVGNRIYVLLSALMELLARDANGYTRHVLDRQGIRYTGPDIDPLRFAGIASDGRNLENLLAGAPITVRQGQRRGLSDEEALRRGRDFLEMVIRTQAADAARAAESVSITVADGKNAAGKSVVVGWVRMLTPPSCGRCAVLAGKFYRWNSGFKRHPQCDCRHIPITVAGANEVLTNPMVYFNSLTEEEQNRYFGTANAQAIRDGADMAKVVNAQRSGMTTADDGHRYNVSPSQTITRGTRVVDGQVVRPTVWQIYKDANGNQAAAVAALRRFGYVVGR